jgi:hypothetical protein
MRGLFESICRAFARISLPPSCVCGLLLLALAAPGGRAQAAELRPWPPDRAAAAYPLLVEPFCAECIRDAIYANTKTIAHLEANPDVDEAFKGPIVLSARAEIHYWRHVLGPGVRLSAAPCCYWRKRMYVR